MSSSARPPNIDTNSVSFADESRSPRKRFAPSPRCEIATIVTSRTSYPEVDNSKCQSHRQRYPEVEAIVQMFFRTCAFILDITVLMIVRTLDTNLPAVLAVKKLYGVVAYSLLLNALEILSLSNPQPTLLMSAFPWLFPAQRSTSCAEPRPRFPRLPSVVLAVCEFAAAASCCWSAFLLLNPAVEDDDKRGDCPKATCVTPEERDMIYGYVLEAVVGLVHVGFFLMAVVHWGKRRGPGWLEVFEK